MFCPKCGQQQVSNETRFCSRCGLAISGLAEYVAGGAALLVREEAEKLVLTSAKRKGIRRGAKVMFLSGVLTPVFFGLGFCAGRRVPMGRSQALCLDRPVHPVDDFDMSLASIQKEISQLNPHERALLIDLLWESLDEASIGKIEAKWAIESEDRIEAYERGELPAVDGSTALRDLRSSLKK